MHCLVSEIEQIIYCHQKTLSNIGKSRSTMLVTVCAQSGLILLEHTHVVEHATDALLGQQFSGRSDSTLQ